MAGIFNALVNVGKDALDKYMKSSDPNVVKAVNPSEYAPVPVQVSNNFYLHCFCSIFLLFILRTFRIEKIA